MTQSAETFTLGKCNSFITHDVAFNIRFTDLDGPLNMENGVDSLGDWTPFRRCFGREHLLLVFRPVISNRSLGNR